MTNTVTSISGTGWQRRHTVVLLCFLSAFICYIDRVNISVAIIPMAEEFSWSDTKRGLVLSSWLPSYFYSQLGISLKSVWIYVAPPWISSFVVGTIAGVFADRLIAKGWTVTRVCRFMQGIGSGGPALTRMTPLP
ncbi:MAG: hypothetical protein V3S21_04120 [Xanthomonadales bacterium]